MYGQMTVKEGQRDTLVALLLKASQILQEIDGCILYIINESVEDTNVVWVTELWESAEAHALSLKNENLLAVIQQARPLITGIKPIHLRPIGGKGLRI